MSQNVMKLLFLLLATLLKFVIFLLDIATECFECPNLCIRQGKLVFVAFHVTF